MAYLSFATSNFLTVDNLSNVARQSAFVAIVAAGAVRVAAGLTGAAGSLAALHMVAALWVTAFGIFLLRQHFMSIPRSLDEAAELDGCSKLGILWHVILPSSKPALATLAAFGFIWTWTDFYWPLLATSTREMRTLEVGLSMFKESYGATNWPIQMAAAVIVLVPAMAFFLALQRYFVKGVVQSGLKG